MMMETYPNFLTTSSSSTSHLPDLHQMLIQGSGHFRHPHDVSGNHDMAVDHETSDMKNDIVSLNKSFHVDVLDGLEKKNAMGATTTAITESKMKTKCRKIAFQTRSQVDILDDGYRWRKYGQKAVKNNKFRRSYYRCTQKGCKVKKQVQRLARDEGVVVTTYEGIHSHPIDKSIDNFEHILTHMQIYTPY